MYNHLIYFDHLMNIFYVTVDHCRVVLSGDETEDYINASFIDVIFSLNLPNHTLN